MIVVANIGDKQVLEYLLQTLKAELQRNLPPELYKAESSA